MNILKYNIPKIALLIIFLLSIFILLYTASSSYKTILTLTESENLVIHTHKVHTHLEQLVSNVRDAESSHRGFILTRDSVFFKFYIQHVDKVNKIHRDLLALLEGYPVQKRNLARLQDLVEQRFSFLSSNIWIDWTNAKDSLLLKNQILKGKTIMDSIVARKENMVNLEMEMLKHRESAYNHELKVPPRWILLSSLFSLMIFIAAFLKIFRDLRTLKLANNRLMINKEIFEHSEQIAEISSWCWNLDHDHLTFSHNLYYMLGCELHEFEPSFDKFLEFVHPDDRHILVEGNKKMMAVADSSPAIAYFRVHKKNRSLRYYKSIQKVIIDNYSNRILIAIIADTTDQYLKDKILEEKLFDLERSNNELSAFNHVASHDLQEPLRKVQTYISRISEKDFEQLTDKGREYFTRIQVAAGRMQKLIDDLLLFSRTNKADKIFEITDLNVILENTRQELAQSIEEKSAIIRSETLPVVNAIPFQIQQLFNNIIGNSLKYCKPDVPPEIEIIVQMVSGREIPVQMPVAGSDYYKITMADNSIGFEQQYAENIFTLFHRLHDDSAYSGTGIGLTICKKIVENHKGFIQARGIPGVGATFIIFLPV